MNNECFYSDFDCEDCDMKNGCTYQGKIKILQIIDEVEIMLGLPKYFKNLHVSISAITGTPRIVNIDFSKTNCSDKYKNIPIDEWESCLLGYFAHFKENQSQMMIGGDNWEFYIGGNAKTKEDLIKILQQRIEEIQKIS